MTEQQTLEQFAKDLQRIIADAAGVPAYETEAPRNSAGAIAVEPPFVVYTANTRAPQDESGVYVCDLLFDVWAYGTFARCYAIAGALDAVLNGTIHTEASGVICCDQAGQIMQRSPRDPQDERVRRMSSQYALRFYPKY